MYPAGHTAVSFTQIFYIYRPIFACLTETADYHISAQRKPKPLDLRRRFRYIGKHITGKPLATPAQVQCCAIRNPRPCIAYFKLARLGYTALRKIVYWIVGMPGHHRVHIPRTLQCGQNERVIQTATGLSHLRSSYQRRTKLRRNGLLQTSRTVELAQLAVWQEPAAATFKFQKRKPQLPEEFIQCCVGSIRHYRQVCHTAKGNTRLIVGQHDLEAVLTHTVTDLELFPALFEQERL